MTAITARIASTSDEASHPRWRLTEEAIRQLVEQAPGKPVTWNYDATRPLGKVIDARLVDGAAEVVMDLPGVSGPIEGLSVDVGPGFIMDQTTIDRDDLSGEIIVDRLRLRELGLIPKKAGER